MNIRAYTQDDLSAISEIYNRSKLGELKFEDTEFSLLPLEKDEVRFKGLMESEVYVYQTQDQISGFAAIFGNEIRALFVHPESRGRGHRKKANGVFIIEYPRSALLICRKFESTCERFI